jgi:hypothetical protein
VRADPARRHATAKSHRTASTRHFINPELGGGGRLFKSDEDVHYQLNIGSLIKAARLKKNKCSGGVVT